MKKINFLKKAYILILFFLSNQAFASNHGAGGGGNNGNGIGGGGNNGGTGGGGNNASTQLINPLGTDSITEFFLQLLQIVLIFAVPIIVFFIIYAGFLYVTARGNQEQVTRATRALGYAILGGIIILGAQIILTVIQGTVDAVT